MIRYFRIALVCLILLLHGASTVQAAESVDIAIYAKPGVGILELIVVQISDTQVDLSWSKSGDVDKVMIRGKYGEYPADIPDGATAPSDGYLVYYGDGLAVSDTSMNFDENPGILYYKAWGQKADGTWYTESNTGSEESKQVTLIALLFLTLGLSVAGSAIKNTVLTWASVPMWIVLGVFINANYTWLGDSQWVFILLGFGIAAGMAFETTTYRTKVEDNIHGDEIDPELAMMLEQRQNYDKQMDMFKKISRGTRPSRQDRKLGEL